MLVKYILDYVCTSPDLKEWRCMSERQIFFPVKDILRCSLQKYDFLLKTETKSDYVRATLSSSTEKKHCPEEKNYRNLRFLGITTPACLYLDATWTELYRVVVPARLS